MKECALDDLFNSKLLATIVYACEFETSLVFRVSVVHWEISKVNTYSICGHQDSTLGFKKRRFNVLNQNLEFDYLTPKESIQNLDNIS